MTRLKSRSSSKSEREMGMRGQEMLAIASVERSERSKIAISPKHNPGFSTARDFVDGILARRFGGSRVGAVIDPIADKAFMASAFLTVASRGLLEWYELLGVLLRDILAVLGFLGSWVLRRPVALPARAGGK